MTAYSEDTKGRRHITESAFCSSASALCHCVSYLVLFVTSNIYYLGEWTHISCVFVVWEHSTPEQLSRELPVWTVKHCRSECSPKCRYRRSVSFPSRGTRVTVVTRDVFKVQGSRFFIICHIHNHTGYNQ